MRAMATDFIFSGSSRQAFLGNERISNLTQARIGLIIMLLVYTGSGLNVSDSSQKKKINPHTVMSLRTHRPISFPSTSLSAGRQAQGIIFAPRFALFNWPKA